jgi:PAS domain S-box-containing protein
LPEEIVGRSHAELFPSSDTEHQQDGLRWVFEAGQPLYVENLTQFPNRGMWLGTWLVPIEDEAGQVKSILGVSRDITERKRVEEALGESEGRFRSLVETTSDWVWEVDRDGVYTYVSPKITELLGYEPEEIIGKTPFDLMPLDDAKHISTTFQSIVASQKPIERLENTARHKDGRLVVLETSGVPFFDLSGKLLGYRGIDRDITDRKKSEEALRESEERLRQIASSLREVLWLRDVNTRQVGDLARAFMKIPILSWMPFIPMIESG